jgi:hypothetical protein
LSESVEVEVPTGTTLLLVKAVQVVVVFFLLKKVT